MSAGGGPSSRVWREDDFTLELFSRAALHADKTVPPLEFFTILSLPIAVNELSLTAQFVYRAFYAMGYLEWRRKNNCDNMTRA